MPRTSRHTSRLPTALVALTLTVGCADSSRPVIGVPMGASSRDLVTVARDYLREVGVDVDLVFDSLVGGETAELAVSRALSIVDRPGLVGVVGHAGSRGSLAAAPIYEEAGIAQVVPTSTSDQLAEAGDMVFRLVPGNRSQGAFIARFATEGMGARSASVFYATDEYGIGLRDGVVGELASRGVMPLDNVPITTESDFALLVEQSLLRGIPDVVVLATRDIEAAHIIRAFSQRAPDVFFVAGDGVVGDRNISREAPDSLDRLYLVRFWHPSVGSPLGTRFLERFREAVGRDPFHSEAKNFEGIVLLASAVEAGARTPSQVVRYLRSLGANREPFQGVSGTLDFSGSDAPLLMTRGSDGTVVSRSGQR